MKAIATERRKPDPNNPNRLVYDGQRTVQEVFAELRYRLESTGYLPDEYFMLDHQWEDGKEWPEDGYINCYVDYGGSEGIYLDVGLKYQDKDGKSQSKHLITGKTLGESGADMDRMYLIASAITRAFHNEGIHARYAFVGEQPPEQISAVVHMNPEEQKIITESLIATRLRWKQENKPLEKIEQLIRRIVGSITEFVKEVGERPQKVDYYDQAILAAADGDMESFTDALPHIPHLYGSVLEKAAIRPDVTGRAMTEAVCAVAEEINKETYLRACQNAINSNDVIKSLNVVASAERCVLDLPAGFYGDVILHALKYDEKFGGKKSNIAVAIAEQCTPEQIQSADPYLLKLAISHENRKLTDLLLARNISVEHESAMLIFAVAQKKDIYLAEKLIERGVDINSQNHAALFACMNTKDLPTAMFLLKLGADFEAFSDEVTEHGENGKKLGYDEAGFLYSLKGFWENNIMKSQENESEDEPDMEQD